MLPRLVGQYSLTEQTQAYVTALQAAGFGGDIETAYGSRLIMSTDNSVYQQIPQGILYPRCVDDLQCIGRVASQPAFRQVRFAARGGGTGTNGQSLTPGLVVDLSRHMNRILELNLEQGWVRVQAGVVKDQLNAYLKPHGYFFAPDLSTSNRATIGGMINTDASGQGSLVYGKTSDHVLGLTCVLDDGTSLTTRPLESDELDALCSQPDRIGAIYRQARDSCVGQREQILARFPRLNRFLTGYDLEHAIDETHDRFDLGRLITGSEGTLVFVAEAKLNLVRLPRCKALVNVKYLSFDAALRNAPFLVDARATSVETVDSKVLNLARQDIVWHSVKDLIQAVPGQDLQGLNLVEFTADDPAELTGRVDALTARLDALIAAQQGGVIGYQISRDPDSIARIWAMRKKAVGLLGASEGRAKPVAFAEDTAVPPEHLADFIGEFRQLLDDNGLQYGMFGHVDAGVLHVRPALDLTDPDQEALMRAVSDQVVALVAKYGGLMWGEHGRGYRSEYGPAFFGETLFNELRQIKTAFDPANRLNPGKICTPLNSGEALVRVDDRKRGQFERQIPLAVRDSYPGALDCNGNGLCFNYDAASPMCPSFRASGDRRYSPKGRAAMMREWLRQLAGVDFDPTGEAVAGGRRWRQLPQRVINSWRKWRGEYDYSHEVLDTMHECLACKACASQCPVKIDVPEFRSRFFDHYYSRYLRPLRDFVVGYSERSTPLLARWPKLYNWPLSQRWGQQLLASSIGLADAPLLSEPTLRQRLATGPGQAFSLAALRDLDAEQRARTVLVVQDPFTSYYEAELVHDWMRLLQQLGFEPVLLPFKPNGKPEHVKGFLTQFASTARSMSAFLNQLAALELPMVGVDPALVLCYRDEYRQVLGEARGNFEVMLPQEFLLQHRHRLPSRQGVDAPTYYLLGHCTEKTACPTAEQDWQVLFEAIGARLEPLAVGCCGMAGMYGHEKEHLQRSQAIYALSWAAAVKDKPRAQLLATGYSCRSQVKRMAGEKPRHPLQALLAELAAR